MPVCCAYLKSIDIDLYTILSLKGWQSYIRKSCAIYSGLSNSQVSIMKFMDISRRISS